MEIKIKENTYTIKYGFRSLMIYENLTGESFQPNGLNSLLTLFYACLMAGNKDATIEFNDFVDELDEQPEILTEFSNYIVSVLNKNNNISEKEEETEPKKKVSNKKKK